MNQCHCVEVDEGEKRLVEIVEGLLHYLSPAIFIIYRNYCGIEKMKRMAEWLKEDT